MAKRCQVQDQARILQREPDCLCPAQSALTGPGRVAFVDATLPRDPVVVAAFLKAFRRHEMEVLAVSVDLPLTLMP